jgi:alpha-amylase
MLISALTAWAVGAQLASAATADEWRDRAIYQIITDRFAPPSDDAPARTEPLPLECNTADQTWCGGTWLSIIDKLDYIQSMGFDAIWISPTSQNIDFQTPYNFAYHGYWVNDLTKINQRFGSEDDLHKLVDAVHKRDMYIMVDVAINGIPSLSNTTIPPEGSMWTKPEQFHDFCEIDWSTELSNDKQVKDCSLGDSNLWLLDVNTENPEVVSTLNSWISDYVATYKIDGLRIDAAKHVPGEFWTNFCAAGGVFCIGEVFDDRIDYTSAFQREKWMDSILGFPFYNGLKEAFSVEPHRNMSELTERIIGTLESFPDPGVLGNFIENHDTPRFKNITADPRLVYNAMVAQFLFEGIPVLYSGQEQDMAWGNSDPHNRGALWALGYENVTTVQTVTRLNKIRQGFMKGDAKFNGESYLEARSQIVANTTYDLALRKGPILMTLTNRGSPEEAASFSIQNTGWPRGEALIDLLSCLDYAVGSGGSLSISYSRQGYGGMPYVFATVEDARHLGICNNEQLGIVESNSTGKPRGSSAALAPSPLYGLAAGAAVLAAALSL